MPSERMKSNRVVLLDNVSATGSGNFMEIEGGTYQVFADGTFGGTTATLDGQGPNDTTVSGVAGVSLTAATAGTVELRCAKGERLRGTLTGGTPANVRLWLVKVTD